MINLLKRSGRLAPAFLIWENRLRSITMIILAGLVVGGLITGGIFIWLKREESGLLSTRDQLNREIRAQSKKEGLFLLLKTRLGLANQIKASAKPWDKLILAIESLASPPVLRTITSDENEIIVSFQSGSFEEISLIITGVLKLVTDRVVHNPQVKSMAIDENGQIKLVLGLQPIL